MFLKLTRVTGTEERKEGERKARKERKEKQKRDDRTENSYTESSTQPLLSVLLKGLVKKKKKKKLAMRSAPKQPNFCEVATFSEKVTECSR